MTKDFIERIPKDNTNMNNYFCDHIKTNTLKGRATINYLVEHDVVTTIRRKEN